ncbi:MAG TPA: Tad domain-containing protein [Candidatus Limnocylindria bacterium]|nr:Tad domain-containing protein [Candidatus Limnocylindria bacterium]
MSHADAPRGQVLVMVAIGLVALLGLAGVAVDVGRVMTERRHLQNAADAAALAACHGLTDGSVADPAAAAQAARNVATINLEGSPVAATATIADPPVYTDQDGDAYLEATELTSGVVVAGNAVRVAIDSSVDTTLAKVVGVQTLDVGARAHCTIEPVPALPLVVRRYDMSSGGGFTDVLATQATSSQGGIDPDPLGYDGRTPASEADPGPSFEIYGNLSKANNNAEFRGFIALDVRDFTDATSRKYYNGVASGTTEQTLKDKQSQYIVDGYPGPGFTAVTNPPSGAHQVATLSGHNSDQLVHRFGEAYGAGDRLLLAVYDGSVRAIPDFAINPPNSISLPGSTAGTPVDGPSFYVSSNAAFTSFAKLELLGDADASDPAHNILPVSGNAAPAPGTMNEPIFTPNNFTPSGGVGTTVAMTDISTDTIPAGIYTVWLKGTSTAPDKARIHPISVVVDGASKDFNLGNSVLSGSTDTLGGTISFDIRLRSNSWGGGDVQLSWDSGALTNCVLTPVAPGTMSVSFSDDTITPSPGQGTLSTMTVNTAGLAPGCYKFPLRATGTNGDSQPVVHLAHVTFHVADDPSDGSYVDIIGFAMFEVSSISGNTITGRAISPICADPSCDALRGMQRPRLIPWS